MDLPYHPKPRIVAMLCFREKPPQISLLASVSLLIGRDLDFELIDTQELMDADISAFCGDLDPLRELYCRIIQCDVT